MSKAPDRPPVFIAVDERDNVAIVANDGGLPAGAAFATGLTLRERIPQGHKVALVDLPVGAPVRRYNVIIGHALEAIPAGGWVNEHRLRMPAARSLDDLPIATRQAPPLAPLDGYTFEGYRNPDGTVGTRNILAITTTVQCVSGVVEYAVRRIKEELLPRYPHVDDVVGLEHTYGCGVAIDAPDAVVPDPHAAQHQPQPELRRRGDGREPGLREAAADRGCCRPRRYRSPYSRRRERRRSGQPPGSSACRTTVTSASCR